MFLVVQNLLDIRLTYRLGCNLLKRQPPGLIERFKLKLTNWKFQFRTTKLELQIEHSLKGFQKRHLPFLMFQFAAFQGCRIVSIRGLSRASSFSGRPLNRASFKL